MRQLDTDGCYPVLVVSFAVLCIIANRLLNTNLREVLVENPLAMRCKGMRTWRRSCDSLRIQSAMIHVPVYHTLCRRRCICGIGHQDERRRRIQGGRKEDEQKQVSGPLVEISAWVQRTVSLSHSVCDLPIRSSSPLFELRRIIL